MFQIAFIASGADALVCVTWTFKDVKFPAAVAVLAESESSKCVTDQRLGDDMCMNKLARGFGASLLKEINTVRCVFRVD